jgi:acetoacetyl-CoA reductase/3-oxoacyl-[acyl-carrier protein] reductase
MPTRKAKAPAGEFAGRVAIVTGAARGLGADVVRALHGKGATVAFSYLSSKDAARALEAELGAGRVAGWRADVSKEGQARAFASAVAKRFGRIDLLVNNASYSNDALWNARIEKVPTQEFERVLAVDLVGSFNMSKCAVPVMRRRRYGRIVNFSSAGSLGGDETMIAYNAAKVGIVGLTRTLARAEARNGITVNAIAPGSIDTGWIKRWGLTRKDLKETLKEIPVGRLGQPQDAVHAVLFLLSERAGFITGQTIRVDGGVNFG